MIEERLLFLGAAEVLNVARSAIFNFFAPARARVRARKVTERATNSFDENEVALPSSSAGWVVERFGRNYR